MSNPMISTIEIQNNLLTDTMDKFDDQIDQGHTDQGHTPPANLSASRQFAASLKLINDEYTYGHEKKQQTGPVVVGFDSERFIKYSDKASPYYDPNITDFNEISRELFQTEEVWVSRDLIIMAMEALAKYHGFTICIEKEAIMCNRNGKNKTSCAYVSGALKTGCTF